MICEGAMENSQSVVAVLFKPSNDVVDVEHWSVTTSWDSAAHQVADLVCGAVFWQAIICNVKHEFPLLCSSGADFT